MPADSMAAGEPLVLSNDDAAEQSAPRDRRVVAATAVIGDRVRNPGGESLGKIEDIMLDPDTGAIAYAVLSFGGFLGMGNKLFALPWRELKQNPADHEFILNVDRQVLESAPGFDKDDWPDMAAPEWGDRIRRHWER